MAHNELLYKLCNFGITDKLWLWIMVYLTDQRQCVLVGQAVSSCLPGISGVPQGSILGPQPFLVFINDLPKSVTTSMVLLFTDDARCVLPISFRSDCLHLQNDLARLCEWCTTWNLSLNEEKCAALHYTCTARHLHTIFNYSLNEK